MTRRGERSPFGLALAAAVLEELLEELLERRAGRKLRPPFLLGRLSGRGVLAARHGLRGRDVDHRVDHRLGDVRDLVRAAALRLRGERERDRRRRDQREGGSAEAGEGAKVPAMGVKAPEGIEIRATVLPPGRARKGVMRRTWQPELGGNAAVAA